MLSLVTSNWLFALFAAATVIVSAVCFFIGSLVSRVSSLEKVMENHYTSIDNSVGRLQEELGAIEREMHLLRDDIEGLKREITEFDEKEERKS